MEAAWDSARNENKKLLNELKKKFGLTSPHLKTWSNFRYRENAIKDVQTVKAVTIVSLLRDIATNF